MESVSGESLYLFRHALLREAAYELYPPSVRAKLHRLVVEIATFLFEDSQLSPLAAELADHARAAWQGTDDESLQRVVETSERLLALAERLSELQLEAFDGAGRARR